MIFRYNRMPNGWQGVKPENNVVRSYTWNHLLTVCLSVWHTGTND